MYKFLLFLTLMIFFCGKLHSGDKNNIAVVTMAIGDQYQAIVRKAIDNKNLYSKIHGYEFFYFDKIRDVSRPIAWSKILFILEVMESSDCNWIFWSDADSVIMNLETCLEDIIDENYNFIVTKDYNNLNTGQFLIKNCPWSKEFLRKIYNRVDCINHPWWENQGAIKVLEETPSYLSFIKILPQRVMNSYPIEVIGQTKLCTFEEGDFIVHFAGIRNPRQLWALINKYSYFVRGH